MPPGSHRHPHRPTRRSPGRPGRPGRRSPGRRSGPWGRGHRSLFAGAGAAVLLAVLLFSAHGNAKRLSRPRKHGAVAAAAHPRPRRPPAAPAQIVEPVRSWPHASLRLARARPRPVPTSFLGLSTEYWTLPHYARQRQLFERVIRLLRIPDTPFTLRIGGNSADMAWWDPHDRRAPGWAYTLTPRWVTETARLVRDAHLRVLLDLNLVDRNPDREAQLAKVFAAHMPRHSLEALEIGNEPDLYPVAGGLGQLSTASHSSVARYFSWASDYVPATYDAQFSAYAAALTRAGVRLPLAGPSLSDPTETEWLPGLLSAQRRRLAFISAHRYPLSACETDRSAADYPTIRRLLAESSSTGLARSVKAAIIMSHRAGLQFELTEFNAVTCGGTAAVSGTFANALWAPDALFSLMKVGADAVDVHVRAHAYNAPFFVSRRGLRAKPIFYGLVMFQRMLRRGSWLYPVALRTPDHTHLKAWAVRSGRVLRVMLIDKGGRGSDVELHLPSHAPATVQRLLAAGPTARRGVRLAGQWLAPNGRWRGRFTTQTVDAAPGRGYEVAVPPYSAALVSVRLAARAR